MDEDEDEDVVRIENKKNNKSHFLLNDERFFFFRANLANANQLNDKIRGVTDRATTT